MDEPAPTEIPNRLFFRIGEVAELAGVEAHVLRFWESEFPALAPKKASNGIREYRRKDVETVLEIKRLLYDDGYTIAGARKVLRERRKAKAKPAAKPRQSGLFGSLAPEAEALSEVKKELRDILGMLK